MRTIAAGSISAGGHAADVKNLGRPVIAAAHQHVAVDGVDMAGGDLQSDQPRHAAEACSVHPHSMAGRVCYALLQSAQLEHSRFSHNLQAEFVQGARLQ